jgi:hypothetical protein
MMPNSSKRRQETGLTRREKKLLHDLREIASIYYFDYEEIAQIPDKDERTARLKNAFDKLVRSQILSWYVLTDEMLNLGLINRFFGKKPFRKLRRLKRFKEFQRDVLEDLGLRQKLRLVRADWKRMPKNIFRTLEKLNTIRNSVAHSFFAQDRLGSKPVYNGRSIFTLDGLLAFGKDVDHAIDALINKFL